MSTQTLTELDALAKDDYLDVIVETTNYKNWFLDKIERSSKGVSAENRKTVFSVESRPNLSFKMNSDNGTLSTPRAEEYEDGEIYISYFDAGFEISDVATKVVRGKGAQASVDAFKRGMKSLQKSFRNGITTVLYGGSTGALAVCETSTTTTVVNVDTVQYLAIGMVVDIATASTGVNITNGTGRQITDISYEDRTITLGDGGGNVTTASTHSVYVTESYGNHFDGMRHIAASGRTLHGINSATAGNEYFDAQVLDMGGDPAGTRAFQRLIHAVGRTGQAETEVFVATRGMVDRLALGFEGQRRYESSKSVTLDGGYEGVMVHRKPVIYDDDCPEGNAFGLPEDINGTFVWKEVGPPDWLENPGNGQIWHLASSSTLGRPRAAWNAWITWYGALGCIAPQRVSRLHSAEDSDPGVI